MGDPWVIEAFGFQRYEEAVKAARQAVLYAAMQKLNGELLSPSSAPTDLEPALEAAELSAVEHLRAFIESRKPNPELVRRSMEAFVLARTLSVPDAPLEAAKFYLRMSCFAYLGDCGIHMRRILNEATMPDLPVTSPEWNERAFATIAHAWLLLVRKRGWEDLDAIFESISRLRREQGEFEKSYLDDDTHGSKGAALELISLYHLAKAIELLATYIGQGESHDIFQQLDFHFERALAAGQAASLIELEMLLLWMHAASIKLMSW